MRYFRGLKKNAMASDLVCRTIWLNKPQNDLHNIVLSQKNENKVKDVEKLDVCAATSIM